MRGRLHGLDALRGIAALMIAVYHVLRVMRPESAAYHLLSRSYLAVDFFFVLSGFVLARTYEHRMPRPSTFLVMRYRRLWPPIAAGVFIGTFLFVEKTPPWALMLPILTALMFLPFGLRWSLNPPSWSIFFEICANVLHAALLWRVPTRVLIAVVAASAAILQVVPNLDIGWLPTNIWMGFPRVLMSYSLGIILWRVNGDVGRLPDWWGYAALPLMFVGASLLPGRADVALVLLCCPLILLAGLNGDPKLGAFLGALSFPLYAVHLPVIQISAVLGLPPIAAFGSAFAVALAVTWAFEIRRKRDKSQIMGTSSIEVATAR